MTPRHLILVVASVAVLAMGVYLFKEVNATPATADVSKHDKPAPTPPPPRPPDEPIAKAPEGAPFGGPPIAKSPTRETTSPPTPPPQASDPPPTDVADELSRPNPRLDAVMAEANKAYDHGDFDEAKTIALKVLAKDPTSTRMMRIVVSSACIDGDSAEAQKHYANLPVPDREQMKVRCARYGITFNDK